LNESASKLSCRGCGASLEYSATDQALKCQYCGTLTEIPRTEEELPDLAQAIVPLTVELTALTDAVYEHLASGDLTPDHLLEHATFSKKDRFYVPMWAFQGSFEAHWTASFGYDHQEHYTDYETRTENGHSRQVPVTKTKTVTDWRPQSGVDTGEFAVVAYAGERLPEAPLDVVNLVQDASRGGVTAFDGSYVSGVTVEPFAMAESEAYDRRAEPQVSAIIDESVRSHAQGDHQRDWHWTGSIDKNGLTLLVPVCHAMYEFEGKQYNVWTSGADATRLVADPLPVDAGRRMAIRLGYLPASAAIFSAGTAVFHFDVPWKVPLLLVGLAVAYGIYRADAIKRYSLKLRKSMLAGRRAAAANTAGMTREQQQELMSSVERPGKPWMARTGFDGLVLPALMLAAALTPMAPVIRAQSAPIVETVQTAQQAPAPAPVERTSALPAIRYQTTAAQETPSTVASPIPAPSTTPEAVATEPAAASSSSSDGTGQATSTPGGRPSSPLTDALVFAKAGDWVNVDEQIRLIKAKPAVSEQGDRKSARSANDEGLALLRANDFAGAVVAFERAVAADGADIEVRNNLGYALIKGGRSDEAVAVLGRVLMQTPDRSSAWANLSEATVVNTELSMTALQVAVHYSANREKTLVYLKQSAETHPNASYRAVADAVLSKVDGVPVAPH